MRSVDQRVRSVSQPRGNGPPLFLDLISNDGRKEFMQAEPTGEGRASQAEQIKNSAFAYS
jgi:hypothetical protein